MTPGLIGSPSSLMGRVWDILRPPLPDVAGTKFPLDVCSPSGVEAFQEIGDFLEHVASIGSST